MAALLAAERECPTRAVMDLRGLDFMDSTRLNELARAVPATLDH